MAYIALKRRPRAKAAKRARYRTPAWVHWMLGFTAGYLLAALAAAPHWR